MECIDGIRSFPRSNRKRSLQRRRFDSPRSSRPRSRRRTPRESCIVIWNLRTSSPHERRGQTTGFRIGEQDVDSSAGDEPQAVGVITQVRTVMDTPSYMSPEQAESKPADARSDIFPLGPCCTNPGWEARILRRLDSRDHRRHRLQGSGASQRTSFDTSDRAQLPVEVAGRAFRWRLTSWRSKERRRGAGHEASGALLLRRSRWGVRDGPGRSSLHLFQGSGKGRIDSIAMLRSRPEQRCRCRLYLRWNYRSINKSLARLPNVKVVLIALCSATGVRRWTHTGWR